jgi:hypothetical protein
VSVDDAKRMFAIYGAHVMRCKGSEVTKTNKYKQSNIVAVPRDLIRAQSKVVLCINMFFVKSLSSSPPTVTIYVTLQHRT